MLYANNFRHMCIVQKSFMGFLCAGESVQEKSESSESQILTFFHYNRNRKICIVLNNQDLERKTSNNNIWNLISIGWDVSPRDIYVGEVF